MTISTRTIVAAVIALSLLTGSAAILQPAFAHARATLTVSDGPVAGNEISVVLGHESEPTYGAEPGIHDGKHGLIIRLSDAATSLPLTGADLKADKYYFKDIKSFEKADSPEEADAMEEGIPVEAVHGEAGEYLARQVLQPGIYGYRVNGTIDYFGVSEVPIDTTIFCTSPEGNTTKFNSPGWSGSFGCPTDINDSFFPSEPGKSGLHDKSGKSKAHSTATEGRSEIVAASTQYTVPARQSSESQGWDSGTLLFGIPIAALAGILGWKNLKRKGDGQ